MDNAKSACIYTILVCVVIIPFIIFLSYYMDSSVIPPSVSQEFGALISLPILLTAGIRAYRGSLRANLIKIGILFYYFHVVYITVFCWPYGYRLNLNNYGTDYYLFDVITFSLVGVSFFLLILFALYYSVRSIDHDKISEDMFRFVPRKSTALFLLFGIVTFCLPLIIVLCRKISENQGLFDLTYIITHDKFILIHHFGRQLLSFSYVAPEIWLGIVMPLMGIAAYLLLKKSNIGYAMAPVLLVKGAVPISTFFNQVSYEMYIEGSLFKMAEIVTAYLGIGKNKNVSAEAFSEYLTGFFSIDLRNFLFILFTIGCFIFSILYLAKMKDMKNAE